jgi:cytochrome P450
MGGDSSTVTRVATADVPDDGYDPFEEFNRSAGMGLVENPYPLFALVRPEHPIKREDIDDNVLVPPDTEEDIDFMPIDRSIGVFTAYSYEVVQQVLKDGETFSSSGYAQVMGEVLGHSILEMDEPEHHTYRGLVQQAFSRKTMENWEREVVPAVVNEHIDAFIDRPERRADLVRELTFPFPVVVIARILGLPREDLPMFHRRAVEVISAGFAPERALVASQALYEYFCRFIAERRDKDGDDLISVLANTELDGVRLNDEEICSFLRLLLPAGAETTYRSSSNLLWGLLTNPDQLDAVRADDALMPQAIEEGLRWEAQLIGIMRTAAKDTEVKGMAIPAGSVVAINIGSANHDETVWDDPERFNIFRPPKQHLAFAWGPHMCLGLHLARMETRVVLRQLFDRLPNLRFDPAVEPPPITGAIFRAPAALPVTWD